MTEQAGEDLYRSYRAVDADGGGDAAAELFATCHLVPLLAPVRTEPILEIGAGTGGTMRALAGAGFERVTGVDTSASQVALARDRGTTVALGDGLAVLEAAEPASLGAVILLDVLEHLTLDELLRLLGLAADRLRPGGLLVARVPNGEGLFGGALLYGDITHQRAYTRRSLVQAFSLRGLETVEVRPVRPMVHGPVSAVRALLWIAVELLVRAAGAAESGRRDHIVTRNVLGVGRRPL